MSGIKPRIEPTAVHVRIVLGYRVAVSASVALPHAAERIALASKLCGQRREDRRGGRADRLRRARRDRNRDHRSLAGDASFSLWWQELPRELDYVLPRAGRVEWCTIGRPPRRLPCGDRNR
jgi:hypothetical protein